jgi:DNA-binding MarR family transcriptional regulator
MSSVMYLEWMPEPDADADLDALVAAFARVRGRGAGPHADHRHAAHAHLAPHSSRSADGDPTDPADPTGAPPRGRAPAFGSHAAHPFPAHVRFGGGGPARLRLLEALAAASAPLSVGEVGDAVGVDQPRASRLIQQAVALGLARREADPDDARRSRVALTDEGRRVARGFRGQRRERLQAALADFTPDERRELVRLMTKLAAAWPDA